VEPPARAAAGRTSRHGNGSKGRQTSEAAAPASPPPDPGDPSRGFLGWLAPPERDLGKAAMEKSLWDAADQFRAKSCLKAQEDSGPILGLIFLRFADARFMPRWRELKEAGGSERRGSREDDPNAYQSEGLLYRPPGSRYQELLDLPEGADIGGRLNEAMGLIEQHNSKLAGVLPRSYNLFTPQLLKELLKRISEIPTDLEFDAFGRIYEYFRREIARSEGQKGGEYFTPTSLVVLITEIVEPFAAAGPQRRAVARSIGSRRCSWGRRSSENTIVSIRNTGTLAAPVATARRVRHPAAGPADGRPARERSPARTAAAVPLPPPRAPRSPTRRAG
jgi:hypothetical protein